MSPLFLNFYFNGKMVKEYLPKMNISQLDFPIRLSQKVTLKFFCDTMPIE